MNKRNKSQLEDLPNELLSDIFKYFDARDLFRACANLNSRFDKLIQSFAHLQLTLYIDTTNALKTNDEIYPRYVHTLVVNPWINFNLQHFPNVRRLRLNNPLPKVLEQLQPHAMPYLEHLSIYYTYNMYEMVLLHENIFSNRFLHLKSCELYERKTLITIPNYTKSPSIRTIKTEFVDPIIFKTILSACPNLSYFKFWIYPFNGIPTDFPDHHNLKRLTIEFRQSDWSYDDNVISGFLKCVPYVEQLEVHRRSYADTIREYIECYDWLSSIVNTVLQRLKKFTFVFHLSQDANMNSVIDENLLAEIRSNFNNVHKGQYIAQFVIDRE